MFLGASSRSLKSESNTYVLAKPMKNYAIMARGISEREMLVEVVSVLMPRVSSSESVQSAVEDGNSVGAGG